MGCGTSTIKYLLFFFNLIFCLGGVAILVTGAIIQWNIDFYNEFFGEYVTIPAIILLVVGSAIFLISFFGCCGAIKESTCMLFMFSVFLGVVFVLQVTGATLALLFVNSVDEVLKTGMQDLMKLYEESVAAKTTWDSIQQGFRCCGVMGLSDWMVPPPLGPGLPAAPDSCRCEGDCNGDFYYNGCYQPMADFFQLVMRLMAGFAIAVAIIELIGIVFSCVLASSVKKSKRMKYGK